MKTDKIYMQDWLEFHPYEKPYKSDFYYLKLCNEVNAVLLEFEVLLFKRGRTENRKKALVYACYLV